MDLREALGILSKSSPYAVTTTGEPLDGELKGIKQYLYVETDIEVAFKKSLDTIRPRDIIFLCGSSGDGKSEILTRYQYKYNDRVDFHLDATHSFEPDKSAIHTLDEVFAKNESTSRPLVVGINIGMLGSYEREGGEGFGGVKKAIRNFLNHEDVHDRYLFLDFESFPKFEIVDGNVSAPFFKKLLNNVVQDDSTNKFRNFYNSEKGDRVLVANYTMLRSKSVQNVIVELLLNARIKKDQFVTARMLLDFIYCILTGPGYIFDNIFSGGDNELLNVIKNFDPSIIRNCKLDLFILHRSLELQDAGYSRFIENVSAKYGISKNLAPRSSVRLFYLLKNTSLDHNYHYDFRDSYNESALTDYKKIWDAHHKFDGGLELKRELKVFYEKTVFTSISLYSNRNAPYLPKGQFFLSSHNGCDLVVDIDWGVVFPLIEKDTMSDSSVFSMHIKVDEDVLDPIPMGINLLSLMRDIVNGYRPNKHDKNSVVLLDELVSTIQSKANKSNIIYLYKDKKPLKLKESPDGEIRVSGL